MNENQQQQLDAFTDAMKAFDAVLAQLPEEGLDWREEEGGWTVREIVHHVGEDCNVYAFIVERALATPGCKVFFGDFPGNDVWGERLAWGERPVEPALALMRAHRTWLAELVSAFPDRWENDVVFYNEKGEAIGLTSTVAKMLGMLTEHMQEHTGTLQRIAEVNQA
ncbi:DinB family protein [bacterium]|nr:DinB family protein [bacterium]